MRSSKCGVNCSLWFPQSKVIACGNLECMPSSDDYRGGGGGFHSQPEKKNIITPSVLVAGILSQNVTKTHWVSIVLNHAGRTLNWWVTIYQNLDKNANVVLSLCKTLSRTEGVLKWLSIINSASARTFRLETNIWHCQGSTVSLGV